jgi:hypothetical protein
VVTVLAMEEPAMAAPASIFDLAERCADAVPLAPGQRRPPSFIEVCTAQPDIWSRLTARFLPAAECVPAQPAAVAAQRRRLEARLGAHADDLQTYVNTVCNIGGAELEAAFLLGCAVGQRFERVQSALPIPVSEPAAPVASADGPDALRSAPPPRRPRRRRIPRPAETMLSRPGQRIEADVLDRLHRAWQAADADAADVADDVGDTGAARFV